jgi:GT2 family glycosyltransferase
MAPVSISRPVSVVVPTIGRPDQLRTCLRSLAACEPRAAEIVVVDQSRGDEVRALVADHAAIGARVVACHERGVALARNAGVRAAQHEAVAMTDDDCTVAPSWVGTASRLLAERPGAMITGRVLAPSDPRSVPSTNYGTVPRDYTGQRRSGVLYTANAAFPRSYVLALGAFDERFTTAEDNDLCYRWLRAGRELWFRPELVVWHHAWRTPDELRRLYRSYWHGQGVFYAKHLRAGEFAVLRLMGSDLYHGARANAGGLARRRRDWSDPRLGALRGIAAGLVRGWSR